MAVEMVLLLVLVSAYLGNSQDGFRVDCPPAVGVVGQTTEISCSLRNFTQNITITAVRVTKIGATDPVFWIRGGTSQGDLRFKLPSREDPSLQITNTAVSDEGLYKYEVVNNRGPASGAFWISVTGQLELDCQSVVGVVGQTTNISCSFRKRFTENVNITAVLVVKRGATAPVFWINSEGDQGKSRFNLPSRDRPSLLITNTALSDEGLYKYLVETNRGPASGTFWISVTGFEIIYIITAGVVIAVLIIVGLLLVFLYHRRRFQRNVPEQTDPDPAETEILHPPVNPIGNVPVQTDPDAAETDILHPPVNSSGCVPVCTTGTNADSAETYVLFDQGEANMGSSQS